MEHSSGSYMLNRRVGGRDSEWEEYHSCLEFGTLPSESLVEQHMDCTNLRGRGEMEYG